MNDTRQDQLGGKRIVALVFFPRSTAHLLLMVSDLNKVHASPRLHNSSNADHKSGSSDSALLKCLIAASLRSERLEQKQRQTAISVQVYAN